MTPSEGDRSRDFDPAAHDIPKYIESLGLDPNKMPEHVGIIMDGNGRWAERHGLGGRIYGHRNAVASVRETTTECRKLGIQSLTLYAFSMENWKRPQAEIDGLMALFIEFVEAETATALRNGIRIQIIGERALLPDNVQRAVERAENATAHCMDMTLYLAMSYGSRQEIVGAVRELMADVAAGTVDPQQITEADLMKRLQNPNSIDLIIRTSPEQRISNFLLFQAAYAELVFLKDVLWPDFRTPHLHAAIRDFQSRERRFGDVPKP